MLHWDAMGGALSNTYNLSKRLLPSRGFIRHLMGYLPMISMCRVFTAQLRLLAVFFWAVPCFVYGQATGFIQITGEIGVQVLLNGRLQGVTNAEAGGLIIENVAAGSHTLRILKPGFSAQESMVTIKPGEIYEYSVRPFSPQVEVSQKSGAAQNAAAPKVGRLVLQTLPPDCEITIESLGVVAGVLDRDGQEVSKKTLDRWQAEQVPVGNHRVRFTALGQTYSYVVSIEDGRTAHFLVNILEGTARDLHAERRTAVMAGRTRPQIGQNITAIEVGAELIWIKPGGFRMGGREGASDGQPMTEVVLTKGYWLGKTEVTQGQFEMIMGRNPSDFKNMGAEAPVENVSWEDAMQYCRKLTELERANGWLPTGYAYTLPTEAQWEYACRGGADGTPGVAVDNFAWYGKNSGGKTHVVGQKEANQWGLQDMLGNVWEWCLDWYAPQLSGGIVTDPMGPAAGSVRVGRGGGWWNPPSLCRAAARGGNSPNHRDGILGFRLALSADR